MSLPLELGLVTLLQIGKYDINFFVFFHHFLIMSPKFLKFKRVQNSAVKFRIAQKRKREITKLNEIGQKLFL